MNRSNPFELDLWPLPRNLRAELSPETMLQQLRTERENLRTAAREREQEIQNRFARGPMVMGMEEQLRLVQLMAEDAKLADLDTKIKNLSSQIRILEEPPVEQEPSRTETIATAAEPQPEPTPAEPPAQSIQNKGVEIKTTKKPQRRSSVMRVVGRDLTEEDRENILDTMARRFKEQSFEGIENYVRPATEEEVHYILWATKPRIVCCDNTVSNLLMFLQRISISSAKISNGVKIVQGTVSKHKAHSIPCFRPWPCLKRPDQLNSQHTSSTNSSI